MVLPAIRPLPPDVWDEFMATLRRGPTPEQVRAVEKALELARRTPVRDASAVKEEAYLPLQDSAHCQGRRPGASATKDKAHRRPEPQGAA